MTIPEIPSLDKSLKPTLQEKIDRKTKPTGALGRLEEIALQVGLIQQSLEPTLKNPQIVVFAADHGITQEGVSAYPAEVTRQMVLNFIQGGAAINVFCRQHRLGLQIVDAGVQADFDESLPILRKKVNYGTRNFLHQKAMNHSELVQCLHSGADIVGDLYQKGTQIIGFGEMGIGNTSSAALLMHKLSSIPLEYCVGRGTGLNEAQFQQKLVVLQKAAAFHQYISQDTEEVLQTFGGFEIAMICGAMLKAASLNMIILVDGFIASAAFLAAFSLQKNIREYALACHLSNEQGHQRLLDFLEMKPLLSLGMHLGEGTGCALAFPILQSAVSFLQEMASFESAGVSTKI
ncbi:MAG: nicotinate-nucleotide--dimethylbenzimidazole phosphoribosyltransferase [Microscillaceae bacterium]|nr:nicotinate-nucleotide--dimethylbenzimidazole phosphoribosyltransferase [Microscillaceae bacterium]